MLQIAPSKPIVSRPPLCPSAIFFHLFFDDGQDFAWRDRREQLDDVVGKVLQREETGDREKAEQRRKQGEEK
jgi:hypothetical protein